MDGSIPPLRGVRRVPVREDGVDAVKLRRLRGPGQGHLQTEHAPW